MAPNKRPRCDFDTCNLRVHIVGYCTFCEHAYCSDHRQLEKHECQKLEACKKEAYEQNAAQLNKERTQVVRI